MYQIFVTTVVTLITLLTAVSAIPTDSFNLERRIVPMTVSIPAFPDAEPQNFTGTIEEIHAQLLEINPNYEEDFHHLDKRTPEEEAEDDTRVSKLIKRIPPEMFKCQIPDVRMADTIRLKARIKWLRKQPGKPELDAHGSKRRSLPNYGNVADGAQAIMDYCITQDWNAQEDINGRLNHIDRWEAVVEGAKC
ncbi:hypothetical protein BJY04DRAFT_212698 [Aspergillus karnatakaensis]|uniref:uncharacterized protein n=1 Tax=Aspergillus karnatakaensis TaxID=1810916 RepID=UPI003CCD0486